MNRTLFSSTTGVNNRLDKSSLVYDSQTGVTSLESCENINIDRSGKLITRGGATLQQAGNYISSYPGDDCFYVIADRTTDSALYKVVPNEVGALTLTGLRSPLTLSAQMDFAVLDGKTYYMNGSEYGCINEDSSDSWPVSLWPRETIRQKVTTPIGQIFDILGARFIIGSGNEVIWTEAGLYGIYDAVRNRRKFESEVTMIAAVAGGCFISDSEHVYFFEGLDPNQWTLTSRVLAYPATKYGRKPGFVDPTFYGFESSHPGILFATPKGPAIGLSDGSCFNLVDKQLDFDGEFTGIHEDDGVITQTGDSHMIVQSAIGGIGSKAVSFSTESYNNIISCGGFRYGINSTGIYLLDQDNTTDYTSTFTLTTSDYGAENEKRFRRMYIEIEAENEIMLVVEVRPDSGAWITKNVTVSAGIQKIRFSIQRSGGKGTYHTIRVSSTGQFKINTMKGKLTVLSQGHD